MHLLTASGAVWGLLALDATAAGRFRRAMGLMCLAVAVDAVDGVLARVVRARQVLPGFDGALLDNLVDYLNFVVVPAWLLARAGALPPGTGLAAAAAICLASAYQFAQADAKAEGVFFKGFPSYWNVLAVYLLALRPAPSVSLAIVLLLCVLVFVPLYYVYPTRTPQLRRLTLTLSVPWSLSVVALVWRYPQAPPWLAWVSLAYPSYYLGLSLWLSVKRYRCG